MTELTRITPENADAFHTLIREDAYPYIADAATMSLGLVEDDTPFGALVMRLNAEGEARLLSLAVADDYRRKGFATELMISAADLLTEMRDVYRITCEAVREPEKEDAFYSFLRYLEFDMEEVESGCFVTTLGTIRSHKNLSGKAPDNVMSYEKLKLSEKKKLYEEEMDLKPLMEANRLEERMSCVTMANGEIESCLIVLKEEDALSVEWARTAASNPARLIQLMQHALQGAADYDDAYPVYLPVLNEQSLRLVHKLFGAEAQRTEVAYRAVKPLYEA